MSGIETIEYPKFDNIAGEIASPELAMWTEGQLASVVRLFEENGVRGHVKQGKREYLSNVYRGSDLPELSLEAQAEIEEHRKEGGITSVRIRHNIETGQVVFAKIGGTFPETVSGKNDFIAYSCDTWHARFLLKHDEDGLSRVTLDTWRLPLTQLEDYRRSQGGNLHGESRRVYDAKHRSMFEDNDGSGIPAGATDVQHNVFGRQGEFCSESTFDNVADLLDIMFDGANEVIAYQRACGSIPQAV